MTLAVILLLGFCAPSLTAPTAALAALPVRHQAAPQAASATKPDAAPAQDHPEQDHPAQDQGTAPAAQNLPAPSPPTSPPGTPPQKSSGQAQPATAPQSHHRKRVLSPNCSTAPASGQTASGSASAQADPAAPKSAPANCPPARVIVRQGGISEPSIQLAGGATGDQKSHARDTANQMLESTNANLKKIAGRQLSANQQDMVTQTRQFMAQAKAAVDDGDLERARTLAWKAQLLSEELVKPEK
jgi:hypothetical protein